MTRVGTVMSLGEGEMHAVAGVGVGLLCAGFVVVGLVTGFSDCERDADAGSKSSLDLDDMEAIEASIAYKKSPAKQPQKKTRQPDEAVKAPGVSRDENKKPTDKKPEDKKPTKDEKPAKTPPDRRPTDEDLPVNDKPVTDVGEFNDSSRGFADVTAGDPFYRELAADFNEIWQWPEIIKTQATAAACLHILVDGKIEKTKVDPKSGEPQLDESLAAGLKQLQTKRNANPTPVPTHLIKQATTRWICFKAKTPQQ